MARFWLEGTMITCPLPAATASSTAYWMTGLSTSGSISLGWALVAGRKRVPHPAAGKTALRTRMGPRTDRRGRLLPGRDRLLNRARPVYEGPASRPRGSVAQRGAAAVAAVSCPGAVPRPEPARRAAAAG